MIDSPFGYAHASKPNPLNHHLILNPLQTRPTFTQPVPCRSTDELCSSNASSTFICPISPWSSHEPRPWSSHEPRARRWGWRWISIPARQQTPPLPNPHRNSHPNPRPPYERLVRSTCHPTTYTASNATASATATTTSASQSSRWGLRRRSWIRRK